MEVNLTGTTNINLTEGELAEECYRIIRRECRNFQRESTDDAGLGCFVRGVVELQTILYGDHCVCNKETGDGQTEDK